MGTRKGLKIPTSDEDLIEYINFSSNLALPILKRLKKAITFIDVKMGEGYIVDSLSNEMKNILKQIDV